jgi:hypothetical protein
MSVRNFGLTDFRPLPSPAVNHYSIGFGVVAEQSTGYPGYDSLRAMGVPEQASAATGID